MHDRQLAKSILLDHVTQDPDGMPRQAELIRVLLRRLEAAGHPLVSETWAKQVAREFQTEAAAFELDAAKTFSASPTLQGMFSDLADFLRFRRAKAGARQIWSENPDVRAQFETPEKLLEAAFHNDFPHHGERRISAHSRLPDPRDVESTANTKRR